MSGDPLTITQAVVPIGGTNPAGVAVTFMPGEALPTWVTDKLAAGAYTEIVAWPDGPGTSTEPDGTNLGARVVGTRLGDDQPYMYWPAASTHLELDA